jgi:hypothetical protein
MALHRVSKYTIQTNAGQMQAAFALMVSRRCPAAVAADGKGLS